MHSCTCTIRNATNGNWDDKLFLSTHKWLLYGVNKRKCQKNTKIKSQSIIRPKCLANFVHIWRVWWCFSNVFTFTTFHCSCILIHFPSALPALFPVFLYSLNIDAGENALHFHGAATNFYSIFQLTDLFKKNLVVFRLI